MKLFKIRYKVCTISVRNGYIYAKNEEDAEERFSNNDYNIDDDKDECIESQEVLETTDIDEIDEDFEEDKTEN